MADLNQIYDALRKADAAGNVEDAKRLADYIRQVSGEGMPKEAEPVKDTGFFDMTGRAVVRGAKQTGSLLADVLPAMAAKAVGADEYAARQMANDIYLPSVINESIGEIIVAIDTSGSIGSAEITEFATELVSICEVCQPEAVRVLWWDTQVHGEQVFKDNYSDIAKMLKRA